MAIGYATTLRNARLDAITTAADAGSSEALLRIYSGTRPATGGTPTTLLAELTCDAPFAPAASNGILTVNPITQDSSANASGTATWWRLVDSDGTFVMDGDVGVAGSGKELILNSTTIVATTPVAVASFIITAGNA